jgi:hypothetical protein
MRSIGNRTNERRFGKNRSGHFDSEPHNSLLRICSGSATRLRTFRIEMPLTQENSGKGNRHARESAAIVCLMVALSRSSPKRQNESQQGGADNNRDDCFVAGLSDAVEWHHRAFVCVEVKNRESHGSPHFIR